MKQLKSISLFLLGLLTTVQAWADNFATGDGTVHTFKVSDVAKVATLKSTGTWTISMEVETNGNAFNEWGSVAIASGTNPIDGYSFQLYMNKEGNNNGTLTLFGADTGVSSKYDFTAEIKYNGTRLSGHFIGKDANGNAKETGANDSWYFTRTISDISDLSYALPVGTNIKSLTITTSYDPIEPEVVSFDPAKFYIIKHKATGLYLNTNAKNAVNNSNNSTVAMLSNDQMMATVFTITENGSGFNLKEVNNGKYISVKSNGWDANYSENANGSVIYIEAVGDDFIIKKSDSTNGNIYFNCDKAQDGTRLYFNIGNSTAWVIEEVPPFTRTFTNYQIKLVNDSKDLYMKENAAGNSASKGAIFSTDGSVFTTTITANKAAIYDTTTGKYFAYNPSKANWGTLMQDAAYQWDAFVSGGQICFSHDGSYYAGNGSANQTEGGGIYAGETSRVWWEFVEAQPYTVNIVGSVSGGIIYNGDEYTTSFKAVSGLTTGILTPIPVDGYQASITMSGTTITVTYTANQVVDNPQAITDLLNRIGGNGTSAKFVTRLDEGLFANDKDKFIIGNQGGKPYIQGSSMTAIATGINWYLNHDAHINISWNQLTADIAGATLPAATPVEKTCDADYRYYLNYCTFGYSMTTWTWDRWQKEIDWMALHGINMPLQIIGLEEVWRKVLVQYNYTDDEAKAFAAGPAFTAWWGMNNLEGWGGTTDDAWFARQAKLGKDICDRMKELGMQPVLPGFAAIVPHDFTSKNPAYASESQGNWGGSFVRPWIMDPSGAKFSEVAEKYYKALEEVLGTSKYYSMDPFHEGGAISSGKYAEGYKAIYDAMNDNCGSDTKWVIQQWQWAGYQKTSLTAVPAGRLIVLDLFADGQPAFDSYNGYAPQEAVFSTIPNFGGRSGFMGRLDNMASNYFTYKAKYSTIKGIGAAPEAIESVPVVYDLLFELPWMGSKPQTTDWVAAYTASRYGTDNANAKSAWSDILGSAMGFGADAIQGPIEDVWAARPNLDATPASKWGKTIANATSIYTPERRQKLTQAFIKLVGESDNLSGSNYEYDLIEVGSQVMADYAYDLLLSIKEAKTAGNTKLFNQRKQLFLDLILDMDAFKGTHHMFRLGNWTQTARDAAAEVQGATTATPDWYELDNARTIITTWGDRGPSEWGLRDYSYRSWQGLLKDYYYPRWEYYFNHNCTAPSAGWFYSEWNWAHELKGEWGASTKGTQMKTERTYYSPTPEGNTVEVAKKLLTKYIYSQKLDRKFYTFTETGTDNVITYFHDKDNARLVRYSTDSNSASGIVDEWGDKLDPTKWTITEQPTISVMLNKNTVGDDADNCFYGTLYCPTALTMPTDIEIKAYIAEATKSIEGTDYITLKKVCSKGETLTKQTAVILYCDDNTKTENKLEVSMTVTDSDKESSDNNLFAGNILRQDMSGEPLTYVLGNKSGIGLYKYTGETLPAFKAYYQPKEVNNAPAFRFSFDDIVDAIHHIENGNVDTPIYDLNGRRIMNRWGQSPSIHIQNGKKIIH